MTDNSALLKDTTAGADKIDLTKYRTADLADQLTELISVPEAFRKILKAAFLVAILSVVASYLIHLYADLAVIPRLGICAYSLVIGAVLGVILGVLRIIASALKNIESVLRIILETTGNVAKDYQRMQTGQLRLPSAIELMEQVYGDVVLPVFERSVANAFGFLSTPILWAYRWTLGSSLRYLIKRASISRMTAEGSQDLESNANSSLAAIAEYSETITAYTSRASEVVGNVGKKVRYFAMLPMYILFVVSMALATIPIILVRYFASG